MSANERRRALGDFIRLQRSLARLSLRQLAEVSHVSNAYLSQVERGLYMPSAQVLKNVADALHVSAETLFARAGLLDETEPRGPEAVEEAIRADSSLSPEEQDALIRIYRGLRSD